MKVFANREIRILFRTVMAVWAVALALTQGIVWHTTHAFSFALLLVFLLLGGCLWGVLFRYFQRQSALLEQAVQQIQSCLDGNPDARLDCDREGELYRLFHSVNALAAVLSAHADNEQREKRFLKNTIADISHQLKTPLAALNIYNGLLQDEAVSPSEVKEFADLSEQELDRIETLVQNLLKITRLDAGSVVLEKKNENVAEMVQDIARQYHYRAEQEQKKLILSGSEAVTLWCDRDWMQEAVDNLVKNALDHTKSGDTIQVEWNALPSMVQIKVHDNGSGIHPEDLYHIFKRFYRSRFSQDTQGIGLGLPLAKAVVEAHHGTIEVDMLSFSAQTEIIRLNRRNLQSEGYTMELLEVNHLCKTYGSGETAVHALKDVSFSVPKGEYVAVVGESGSGKSTLLNLIGGLDTPTSGKVLIDGKDVFAMKDRELTIFRRRNIGFIFQAFNLIPELTVEQNILFPVLLDYQKPDRAYLEELLTVLNLKDRRKHLPSQLSGGQQQRVAIGRALMTRPSLILADEPTGNLDTQNTSEVIALLKETSRKYEQTILMITHNRSIAQTADRVLQVSDGCLTDFGRCRE